MGEEEKEEKRKKEEKKIKKEGVKILSNYNTTYNSLIFI